MLRLLEIITIACLVLCLIVKRFAKAENSHLSGNNFRMKAEHTMGCATSAACQNMNLRKASAAGYDSNQFTFCNACSGIVKRAKCCSDFYPRGWDNGICAHASAYNSGHCFCEVYGQTVFTKESCLDYLDFFDTVMGQNLIAPSEKR